MARDTDLSHQGDQPSGDVQAYVEPEFCEYCGAPLNPMLYFCPSCATPFKAVERVIPPHRPRRLAGEELVMMKAPQVWTVFWVYAVELLFLALIGSALYYGGVESTWALWALSSAVLFITTCILGGIYWRSLRVQLANPGFLHWSAWAGVALLAPMLLINVGYHAFLESIWFGEDLESFGEMLTEEGRFGLALVLICVMPAITEEVAFRGLIQHWLQVAIKPWYAIGLASALFAAAHFSVASFPTLFLVGALLGWVRYRSGSLYPCMLIHFLHNFAVISYEYYRATQM